MNIHNPTWNHHRNRLSGYTSISQLSRIVKAAHILEPYIHVREVKYMHTTVLKLLRLAGMIIAMMKYYKIYKFNKVSFSCGYMQMLNCMKKNANTT